MWHKNKLVFSLFLILLLGGSFWLGTKFASPHGILGEKELVAGSLEKFEYLSRQSSNRCGLLGSQIVASYPDTEKLQGSCCAPMKLESYQEQFEGLKEYFGISQIPKDPYDIPVSLAKELLSYKKDTQLTSEQEAIYEEATGLSEEGGPCCCRCWRWDAFEGLAKYLITKHEFTADQIAVIWDLEDGCGG